MYYICTAYQQFFCFLQKEKCLGETPLEFKAFFSVGMFSSSKHMLRRTRELSPFW